MTAAAPAHNDDIPPGAGVYLRACIAPLEAFLARTDITDIYVNRPGEVWVETIGGGIERLEDPRLTDAALLRLARQLAALTHQGLSREHPLLSATLPDGSRIQIVAPPATRGPLALAVRKQVAPKLMLADYVAAGSFDGTSTEHLNGAASETDALQKQIVSGDLAGALVSAVRARRNILISGGTSTGKTTFLNALLREVPEDERLILIEDTPELHVDHPNAVGLIAVRGAMGEAQVTANDLVSASMRMRPDRVILGELRGTEAFAFLRAVNSGHPGSMTTIHADSPEAAVEQLVLLVLQAGTALSRSDVREYVSGTIDVFVQLARAGGIRTIQRVVCVR